MLPKIGDTKKAKIRRLWSRHDDEVRRPVSTSMGCHLKGAALPHPDMTHFGTTLGGIKKRFLAKPPSISPTHRRGLKKFVKRWLEENLVPLASETDTSFETWIENTNYERWRKDQLTETYTSNGGVWQVGKHTAVNSFVKDEFYLEFKHPRLINSRHDMFKCVSGPYFKLIEKALFSNPWFIKKIPVSDRAQYIMDRIYSPSGVYLATDYTAFETHFTKEMMETVEFQLYRYLTQYLPGKDDFYRMLDCISGTNKLYSHNFSVELEATRMSGEMCTSLGNGFSNLMFMLYACHVAGSDSVIGVVEGDDGLFRVEGKPPTSELFKEMGLTIKLESHSKLSDASFCGLIFDEEDRINISDPIKVLCAFGWTDRKYAKAKQSKLNGLLRSKALSLLYEYKNAPVFQALARYALRVTEGTRARSASTFNLYEKEMVEQAYRYYNENSDLLYKPVPIRTRFLMEAKFGLSVSMQIKIEQYLDGLDNVCELDIPFADVFVEDVHLQTWAMFVHDHDSNFGQYVRT